MISKHLDYMDMIWRSYDQIFDEYGTSFHVSDRTDKKRDAKLSRIEKTKAIPEQNDNTLMVN